MARRSQLKKSRQSLQSWLRCALAQRIVEMTSLAFFGDGKLMGLNLAPLLQAWKVEVATFTRSRLISPPLLPGEACEGCTVAICCDGNPFVAPEKPPTCDCNGKPYPQ